MNKDTCSRDMSTRAFIKINSIQKHLKIKKGEVKSKHRKPLVQSKCVRPVLLTHASPDDYSLTTSNAQSLQISSQCPPSQRRNLGSLGTYFPRVRPKQNQVSNSTPRKRSHATQKRLSVIDTMKLNYLSPGMRNIRMEMQNPGSIEPSTNRK